MVVALFAGNAWADGYLNPIGGPGGGQFQARCAAGELLTGFELRAGDDVDAIRPLCVTAYEPNRISAPQVTVGSGLIQHYLSANREVLGNFTLSLGDWWGLASGWYGGIGGGITRILCPSDHPIVTGIFVGAEGVDTVIVNNLHLFCGLAAAPSQTGSLPAAVFDAPAYRASKAMLGIGSGGSQPYRDGNTQHCPDDLVAVGVHGRSGWWLDAVGLICGEPQLLVPDPVPVPKKSIAEQVTKTALTQASKTAAARTGIATSTVKVKPSAAYGIGAAGAPAPPATPPVVVPGPVAPVTFSPPLLEDNAQLWACVDAAAGEAEAGVCTGEGSAQAYCQRRNAQRGPAVLIADAQPGIPVRSVSGDVCADACKVVAELQCDH